MPGVGKRKSRADALRGKPLLRLGNVRAANLPASSPEQPRGPPAVHLLPREPARERQVALLGRRRIELTKHLLERLDDAPPHDLALPREEAAVASEMKRMRDHERRHRQE